MKPAITLKEFLKPPFHTDDLGMVYDGNTRLVDVPGFGNENHIAKVRGWGCFQNYENAEQLQDDFKELSRLSMKNGKESKRQTQESRLRSEYEKRSV